MYESVSLKSELRVCPKCANPEKMLISVASVFLSLWICSTESPEHIVDGTGYTSTWLIPSDSVLKGKRAHCTGRHKTSLERALFLYFSFLFNQEENSEREGKSNSTFLCEGTLHAESSTASFHHITAYRVDVPENFPGSQRDLEREKGALDTPCSRAGVCWDRTEATLGFFGLPSSDIS